MTLHNLINSVAGPVIGKIKPPGSKSLTNRALLCAAMAQGNSRLTDTLDSDDTQVMIESLHKLGVPAEWGNDHDLIVSGCAGKIPNRNAELFVGNSGTTIRFLTAALGVAGGNFRLDGVARMRERPIKDLVDALVMLGADVVAESNGTCPPVAIRSPRVAGGTTQVRGNLSSQYLSGLLMAAPLASEEIAIQIDGELVSLPYVEMTLAVMKRFGVNVERAGNGFRVAGSQSYQAGDFPIEPDASAASYFWAVPAICGGRVEVLGLNRNSLQGDIRFVEALRLMGCEIEYGDHSITVSGQARHGIEIDMSDISDTVQTLAAVALFVKGTTTVRGIAHNRVKETDRIGNLAIELRKLGATVEEFEDGLAITPADLRSAEITTYDDHRMAMSLALVGLRQPGVRILDPGCVAKTYPNYFDDLAGLTNSG